MKKNTIKKGRMISMPENEYRNLRNARKSLVKAKQMVRLAWEVLAPVKD
jgi:hypothetical protein